LLIIIGVDSILQFAERRWKSAAIRGAV